MKKIVMHTSGFSIIPLILFTIASGCGNNHHEADAYGNFEADEMIISAQSQGEILVIDVKEGSPVDKDQLIGKIDTTVPSIKQKQLMAQHTVILARLQNLDAQLKVQEEQRINLVREVERMEKLLRENAATQQQYDDITGKLKVLDLQTETIRSQRNIIYGEQSVLNAQFAEVRNALEKCRVTSPLKGVVLEQYVETGELVTPGKALFKIADLEEMELKVYVSGSQLSSIFIGDSVSVFFDNEESMQSVKGIVSWISSQVEFTPKIIQTKEERVNLVYAVKITTKNDGRMKIGMPGEVVFGKQ